MYCPECGMQNPEAAHYCARCGGLLLTEGGSTQTTMSFPLESDTDTSIPAVGDVQAGGPALVDPHEMGDDPGCEKVHNLCFKRIQVFFAKL